MHRSLKEILHNDYLNLINIEDENISTSFDNEQYIHSNLISYEKTNKNYLKEIISHRLYEYFMSIIVILNSITFGLNLETDEDYLKNISRQQLIYICDEILISILFLEFIFKIYSQSKYQWFNWMNLYDFIIIFCSSIEIFSNLYFQKFNITIRNLLKAFRLLQLLRLYRIIKLSRGLQVLTQALIKTVRNYTFSVGILVFLLIYILAIIGQILYGKSENSPWHHFPTSLKISMRLILVDNWNIIGSELNNQGSPLLSRWFLVIAVFIGNRVVQNILVGLMIESVSSVNDNYIKEKRQEKYLRNQKKRQKLNKRTIQTLNTHYLNTINISEYIIKQIETKLKLIQNEIIIPEDLIFSINWLEKLVSYSEKTHYEAKLTQYLIIHIIQSLTNICEQNIKRTD